MMKLNFYSIFDTAAGAYTRPFLMQSDGQAMRSFTDIATDAEHEIGKHPEDYSLCRVGIWDDNKGQITPEAVQFLATALEVVASSRAVTPAALRLADDLELERQELNNANA